MINKHVNNNVCTNSCVLSSKLCHFRAQIQLLQPISKGHPANIRGHREQIAITKGLECELDKRFSTREGGDTQVGIWDIRGKKGGIWEIGGKKSWDMGDWKLRYKGLKKRWDMGDWG